MGTIDFQLSCDGCGGDLRGADLSGECLHCGRSVGETVNLAVIDAATMSVADDVICVSCGYNLRTLSMASVCPECFQPVVNSLRPNELRFSDIRWLRRVRVGVTCLLAGAIGLAGSLLLFVVLVRAAAWTPGFAAVGIMILMLFTMLVAVVGVFRATGADPRAEAPVMARVMRTSARVLALLPLLWAGAEVATSLSVTNLHWLSLLLPAGTLGALPCTLACLRPVARRGQSPGLVRASTVLIWLSVAGIGLLLAGTILGAVQARRWARAMPAGPPMTTTAPATSQPATSIGTAGAALGSLGYVGPPSTAAATSGAGGQVITMNVTAQSSGGLLTSMTALASCGSVAVWLICFLMSLFVLGNYRGLLTIAIATSPDGRR